MLQRSIVLKKIESLVLALLMILSTLGVLSFAVSAGDETPKSWSDSDSTNKIYYIATAADMESFSKDTNAQAGATVYLTADINMSTATEWAPIAIFSGTFDGQGHTISNITVTGQAGLFAVASGEIKDVIINNFKATSSVANCGIVVGDGEAGTVSLALRNVHVKNSTFYAGGMRNGVLIGRTNSNNGTTIENCSVIDTTITATANGSGIATGHVWQKTDIINFYTNASVSGANQVGGLIGNHYKGSLTLNNCVVDSNTITGTTSNVGGLIGYRQADSAHTLIMTDCAYLKTDKKLIANGTEATSATRCITATEMEDQKETLLVNGWVMTSDKMMVGENEISVLVPGSLSTYFTCPIPTTNIYYQRAVALNTDGTIDVRFITVVDSLDHAEVGFNITLKRTAEGISQTSDKISYTTTTVYESITALGETVTAQKLGGKYIMAIVIKNIDCQNYQHDITVEAFVKETSTSNQTSTSSGTVSLEQMIYPIVSAKIEGIELKEFDLLQSANENIKKFIPDLTETISKYCGFELEQSEGVASGNHYLEMVIDDLVAPMHYGYKIENGDLILFAGGAYSMKFAVQDFIKLIRTGQQNRKELILQNGDMVTFNLLDNADGLAKPANSGLRLMSCNVLATFWDESSAAEEISFDMRTEIFKSYLQVFDPDVIGLQEVCNDWLSCLQTICGDGSTWKLATGGGSRIYFVNPILYRSDRYQLVTEGWVNYSKGNSQAWGGRYMTWAVFESIGTGERFALVNVHWSGNWLPEMNAVQAAETLAKLKELQAAYNCQVCITGDFNTADFIADKKGDATVPNPDISHTEYTYLLADGTVKDAKFYAETLVNDIGSVHGYGATAYPRTWSYDHIFCTADTTVRQFYTAWDNHQQFASDHAWVIADIDLSVKKSK